MFKAIDFSTILLIYYLHYYLKLYNIGINFDKIYIILISLIT